MNGIRKLAEIPAGSWTKWIVVGFWLVVLVITFPLFTKLMGAEKNDASAWLPPNAESTKVLNVQARFQSPNIFSGVVVSERSSGLTAAAENNSVLSMPLNTLLLSAAFPSGPVTYEFRPLGFDAVILRMELAAVVAPVQPWLPTLT